MFNDIYYTNQYVASVGGATLQNINLLESFFMEMIDWNLFISEEEFYAYDRSLENYAFADEAFMASLISAVSSPALGCSPQSMPAASIAPAYIPQAPMSL